MHEHIFEVTLGTVPMSALFTTGDRTETHKLIGKKEIRASELSEWLRDLKKRTGLPFIRSLTEKMVRKTEWDCEGVSPRRVG